MKTVWVTRTLPGALATAERVRAVGLEPLVAPLLAVVPEAGGEVDLTGVDTLAFTSANGVHAFAARTTARDLAVFTVGRGTARAAREAGFAAVTASDGDVLALARAIPPGAAVLHPGAAEPAADLVLALGRRGITARGLVVYRTDRVSLSDAELTAASTCDFVLLQSAKAARVFRDLGFDKPRAIALSPAIASLLPSPERIAPSPTEDALIAALVEAAR